jgi:DNA-binding LacI/PurR family transcriptional regulator
MQGMDERNAHEENPVGAEHDGTGVRVPDAYAAVATMPPGDDRAVTMQDIADRCGVSLITVSRALRGDPRVKGDTARRVHEAAETLGYDPALHHAARRLALRKHGLRAVNHVIAAFFHGQFIYANYFLHMFQGIMNGATAQGFALLTADHKMPELLPFYSRGDVDGFIICGWCHDNMEPLLSQLRRSAQGYQFPVVALLAPAPGCAAVLTDDRGGAYQATAHLLDLGHRHLLHFWSTAAGINSYFNEERRAGCRQACLDRGLDPDRCLHETITSGAVPLHERVVAPLTAALDRHPEITGVLLPNDSFAGQAREVLRARGLRIPEDISLIGFDDTDPLHDENGRNILTSVRLPLEAVGRQAADHLIHQVMGGTLDESALVLPTELVVRASTAPARNQ